MRDCETRLPTVWWIGVPMPDAVRRRWSELSSASRTCTNLAEAEQLLRVAGNWQSDTPWPELLVVSAARPGEAADAELARLQALAPLVRIWRVAGSWCEGEQRTGRPPQGCTTSYWHQFTPLFEQELLAISAGRAPRWQGPVTAHADERPLADAERALPRGSGLIAIVAGRTATAEALADVCQLAGYETLVVAPDARWQATHAKALLWDTTCEQLARTEFVEQLRAHVGGAPIVAVVGFPRPDDIPCPTAIAAVLSKPYRIDDLLWELGQAIEQAADCRLQAVGCRL